MDGSSGESGPTDAGILRRRELVLTGGATTRRLTLTPGRQVALLAGSAALGGWLALTTGATILGHIEANRTTRDIALMQEAYETRIAVLRAERDTALTEAGTLRARFADMAGELARQQDELIAAFEAERAQRLTLAAVRRKLADTVRARDHAERRHAALSARLDDLEGDLTRKAGTETDLSETLGTVSIALAESIAERESAVAEIGTLHERIAGLEESAVLDAQKLERLLGRLEEAVVVSLGKLENALAPTGFDVDQMVAQLRASYSGEGGPFIAVSAAALSEADPQSLRIAALMGDLERVQLMRMAAAKLPLAIPVRGTFRFTSGYGTRTDPRNGRTRQHNGIDLAGDRGTPIHATADGVVIFAGRQRGFGNLIKIRHAFGVETLYAHLNRIRVKVGDKVAQGDRIGDMGNTGRSTGTHLHYEVRLDGKPVNPMSYLKAARDVL